jgi:rsbT co-antagonist protein RsbR
MAASMRTLNELLQKYGTEILPEWIELQRDAVTSRPDLIQLQQLRDQSQRFLAAVRDAVHSPDASDRIDSAGWEKARGLLADLSAERAFLGFSPAETATFVLSLKQPLLQRLRRELRGDTDRLADEVWNVTALLDQLALYSTEIFQKRREEVIARQQQEMLELSTPVVELWEGVLALPLIGTLDSARTQVVMESLLEKIVESGSSLAIIDITGVPTVDTLVAQHLLKTVAAARLMGAECIISGIRPQIAQTIVHLGVDLGSVVTKASLAGAFEVALARLDLTVAPRRTQA